MKNNASSSRLRPDSGRRRALRVGAKALTLAGVTAATGPWIVRDALSSSGRLSLLIYGHYLPRPILDDFSKKTGIAVTLGTFGSNEELKVRLKSTRGRGFDLVSPPGQTALQWRALDLLQPIDLNKIPIGRLIAEQLRISVETWTWDGGLHHLPYLWGTEGLAWRTDRWSPPAEGVSYGDLWKPDVKGAVMGRAHSLMLGMGLWLDAIGELPSNRMLDAYKSGDDARRIWSKIMGFASEHRNWVKLFWNDSQQQISGFLQNNITLGQTLDGPPFELRRAGHPIVYRAPVEGALAWLDGLSVPKGAENYEQILAFFEYIYTPSVSAEIAAATGHNPVVAGALELMSEAAQKESQLAYPGDALDRLWWWPPEPVWYTEIRNEYRDRFIAAS